MRKSCINDRTIAKIMIIREEFYSKNVMWSILRYNTCSNHSHILIWRWIILIELIWWFQSLSRNSIIIRARNLIIRLTIWRFYLLLNKICCEHVYQSQDDEILLSHKEIRKRDFVYKSRIFFVDKTLSYIDSINTSNLRLRKSVLLLFDCFRTIILTQDYVETSSHRPSISC